MKILYVTCISGNLYAGHSYSIPNQILAQSKVDDVFWYNINSVDNDLNKRELYHDLNDYKGGQIRKLPKPYNNPDIIVVEPFYSFARKSILKEIKESGIPYVVVPRGELTKKAQERKKWKKKLANFIIFKRFASEALCIQYLTNEEQIESGTKWNRNSIVIPNGINKQSVVKNNYNNSKLRCVYIGRIEPYQKGLDFLFAAVSLASKELIKSNVKIDLYGSDVENNIKHINSDIKRLGIENIISVKNGVYNDEKKMRLLESDVFIQTSRFEGQPMGLIEALSYGIPCFVTRGTNMKDEIDKFDAGWSAENEIESIKLSLIKMLNEKDKIREKGLNAIRLANQYDWESIALYTHSVYEGLLKT